MSNFMLHLPVRVVGGIDCIRQNSHWMKPLGKRALIVTGKHSAKSCGAYDDVIAALTECNIEYELFDEVMQNPYASVCQKGAAKAREWNADFIIAIGGGSPLDAAKAMAILARNPMESAELYQYHYPNGALPLVFVGTTAGTGSEISPFAIISNDETGEKKSIAHDYCYGTIAYCDPKYTYSLPYNFTVSTALDAFAHAVECYFNRNANEVTDLFAIRGAQLVLGALRAIEGKEQNEITPDQRANLFYGSLYAGVPLAHNGTAFCHPMGYFLSEEYGVTHGRACTVYMPEFLRRSQKLMPQKAAVLFQALGLSCEEICEFLTRINNFTPFELSKDKIEALLKRWDGCKNFVCSPEGYTVEEARKVMYSIYRPGDKLE